MIGISLLFIIIFAYLFLRVNATCRVYKIICKFSRRVGVSAETP